VKTFIKKEGNKITVTAQTKVSVEANLQPPSGTNASPTFTVETNTTSSDKDTGAWVPTSTDSSKST
jgi:hypothetical protein